MHDPDNNCAWTTMTECLELSNRTPLPLSSAQSNSTGEFHHFLAALLDKLGRLLPIPLRITLRPPVPPWCPIALPPRRPRWPSTNRRCRAFEAASVVTEPYSSVAAALPPLRRPHAPGGSGGGPVSDCICPTLVAVGCGQQTATQVVDTKALINRKNFLTSWRAFAE